MIRMMEAGDKPSVLDMMRTFYASPAVLSNGSEEIFKKDVDTCLSDSPYLEGYVMEEAGIIQGYAMAARSYSTEFGRNCIWIEDLYIKEAYRGRGIGGAFLRFIAQKYPDCVLRLEVEPENEQAVRLYEKEGFRDIAYSEMIKFT